MNLAECRSRRRLKLAICGALLIASSLFYVRMRIIPSSKAVEETTHDDDLRPSTLPLSADESSP